MTEDVSGGCGRSYRVVRDPVVGDPRTGMSRALLLSGCVGSHPVYVEGKGD